MTEADPPKPPQLVQTSAQGPWDDPSYRYRDAEIHCLPSGQFCGLTMRDHPLNGVTFGVVGTIPPLIDLWLDERRLPGYIRAHRRPR
jgi:hypothetical protein